MTGGYITGTIGTIAAFTLACAAPQYNAPGRSDSYKKQYEQKYSASTPTPTPAPKPAPIAKPVETKPEERQLTIEEMLAVKEKIKTADGYTSRNLPGNALLYLLQAQEIAGTSFRDELKPRLDTTTAALKEYIDVYQVNIHVTDQTQSGRQEYLQYALLDKAYKPGIEAVSSGGAYTLTVDVRTIEVDEKTKSQRYTILVPTGTMKTLNGEYAALQQTVDIECADYFARRDAARGAGVQAFNGFAGAINTASASNGTDLLGIAFGLAKTIDASSRVSAADAANHSCQEAQEELQATSMFTSDTITTPHTYTEEVFTKTATAGVRFTLTTNKGAALFSSPPLEFTFMREDLIREEIATNNIKGDPEETISDKEVIRGVLQTIPQQVYHLTNQGGGLWDLIALQNVRSLTGEKALEAYVQLYFDAHQPATKRAALDYIVANSDVSATQLAKL